MTRWEENYARQLHEWRERSRKEQEDKIKNLTALWLECKEQEHSLTEDAIQVVSDLSAEIASRFSGHNGNYSSAVIIGILIKKIKDGDPWALEFGKEVLLFERDRDYTMKSWHQAISGQCFGVTGEGKRCTRTFDTPRDPSPEYVSIFRRVDNDYLYLCRQHEDQAHWTTSLHDELTRQTLDLTRRRIEWVEHLSSIKEPQEQVYFVGDGKYIKIGRSQRLAQRLTSLKSPSRTSRDAILRPDDVDLEKLELFFAIPGGAVLETEFHRLCGRWLCIGEWFHHTEELVEELFSMGIDLRDFTKAEHFA